MRCLISTCINRLDDENPGRYFRLFPDGPDGFSIRWMDFFVLIRSWEGNGGRSGDVNVLFLMMDRSLALFFSFFWNIYFDWKMMIQQLHRSNRCSKKGFLYRRKERAEQKQTLAAGGFAAAVCLSRQVAHTGQRTRESILYSSNVCLWIRFRRD